MDSVIAPDRHSAASAERVDSSSVLIAKVSSWRSRRARRPVTAFSHGRSPSEPESPSRAFLKLGRDAARPRFTDLNPGLRARRGHAYPAR